MRCLRGSLRRHRFAPGGEVGVAFHRRGWKLIDVDEVLELIKSKPGNMELILTGRYADSRLIDAADLVTVMVKVKHPYDRGIPAREGIDY